MLVAAGTVLQNDDALIHYWSVIGRWQLPVPCSPAFSSGTRGTLLPLCALIRRRTLTTSPPCIFCARRCALLRPITESSCLALQMAWSAPPMRTKMMRTRLLCMSATGDVVFLKLVGSRRIAYPPVFGRVVTWRLSAHGRMRFVAANVHPDFDRSDMISLQLQIAHDLDIRAPSVHSQRQTWVTDYLIGCHMSSESGLGVFVGSNE